LDAQTKRENQMTFEKGQSENRAGRPPGARNKTVIPAEAMYQGIAPARARCLFFLLLLTG
jgi:hypothetical protein